MIRPTAIWSGRPGDHNHTADPALRTWSEDGAYYSQISVWWNSCIAGSTAASSRDCVQGNDEVRSFNVPAVDACCDGVASPCARDDDAGYSVTVRRCTHPLYHDWICQSMAFRFLMYPVFFNDNHSISRPLPTISHHHHRRHPAGHRGRRYNWSIPGNLGDRSGNCRRRPRDTYQRSGPGCTMRAANCRYRGRTRSRSPGCRHGSPALRDRKSSWWAYPGRRRCHDTMYSRPRRGRP